MTPALLAKPCAQHVHRYYYACVCPRLATSNALTTRQRFLRTELVKRAAKIEIDLKNIVPFKAENYFNNTLCLQSSLASFFL